MIKTAMNDENADNWKRTVEIEWLVFTNQKGNSGMSLQNSSRLTSGQILVDYGHYTPANICGFPNSGFGLTVNSLATFTHDEYDYVAPRKS